MIETMEQFERAATQPPGTWIRGHGYDQTRLRERRWPVTSVGPMSAWT